MRKIYFLLAVFTFVFFSNWGFAQNVTIEEQAGIPQYNPTLEYHDEFNDKKLKRQEFKKGGEYKDPRLACLLSVMAPGAGQIYLREDLKGVSFALISGASYATGAYFLYKGFFSSSSSDKIKKRNNLLISGVFLLVGAVVHTVSVVESYNTAVEINEQHYYYGDGKSESPYIAKIEIK